MQTANIAVLVSRNVKPVHAHDCDKCVFLGSLDGSDLYFCPNDGGSYLARHGEGADYGCFSLDMGLTPRPGTAYALARRLLRLRETNCATAHGTLYVPNAYTTRKTQQRRSLSAQRCNGCEDCDGEGGHLRDA